MKTISDHFQALKLRQTRSHSEIKEAYKKLAKKLHPDSGGSEAEFKELGNSYKECLEFADGMIKPSSQADMLFLQLWEEFMVGTNEGIKFSPTFSSWFRQKILEANTNLRVRIQQLQVRKKLLQKELGEVGPEDSYSQSLANTYASVIIEKINNSILQFESQLETNEECLETFEQSYKPPVQQVITWSFSYT